MSGVRRSKQDEYAARFVAEGEAMRRAHLRGTALYWGQFVVGWGLIFTVLTLLFGCLPGLSQDPEIAAKQTWVKGCQVADSNLRTAEKLWNAGQLPASAREPLLAATDLYEIVCTGEPPPPGADIASMAVKILAAKVCPTLAPSDLDEWYFTAIDAAACVAEGALLAESG